MSAGTPYIAFDGVWKKFRRGEVHTSLRDLLPALTRNALKGGFLRRDLSTNEFWALRDVSFAVEPGQTLGIIGNNGAGKSTILKILTRILRPNRGRYAVKGRVGALLEIAAGFHQDLTGRENVFLQGAIMGMGRQELKRKLDAIVAFSGVELFIDSPVKAYSSGMNARLGFAIAAHLDPDVLIIDEALSVGDYAFQRKAFGRIRTLAKSGIPVVVVSHQLDRISELCTDVLLLANGETVAYGSPSDVIAAYMRGDGNTAPKSAVPSPVTFDEAVLVGSPSVRSGSRIRLRLGGRVVAPLTEHIEPIGIVVRSAQTGETVFETGASMLQIPLDLGDFQVEIEMQMNVQPGIYLIDVDVWDRATEEQFIEGPRLTVRVVEGDTFLGGTNLNARLVLAERTATIPA